MVRLDRISGMFWVGIAIAIGAESIRLGPGSLSEPGPGLLPFGCGLILGILGLTLYFSTFKIATERRFVPSKKDSPWTKSISALASIIGYAFLVDFFGFLLVTFLWMGFMCRLGRTEWKTTIFVSVIATLFCYIVFIYGLAVRFPRGILGF